jgi:uncharacterized protein YbjT (DUF2867 family)
MSKVLILGASGQIARWVIGMLADAKDLELTLFLRHKRKLQGAVPGNAHVIVGNVLDDKELKAAMTGQNIVYANLTGEDIDQQAEHVIAAMQAARVRRLIFITSLGIYDEVPGKFGVWNQRQIGAYLPPFRRAADALEASGLDFTVLRPAWLQDEDEVAYETTEKGEMFKGTEVSRKSVADLIVKIIRSPTLHSRRNLGVAKPGTDGNKPSFY